MVESIPMKTRPTYLHTMYRLYPEKFDNLGSREPFTQVGASSFEVYDPAARVVLDNEISDTRTNECQNFQEIAHVETSRKSTSSKFAARSKFRGRSRKMKAMTVVGTSTGNFIELLSSFD